MARNAEQSLPSEAKPVCLLSISGPILFLAAFLIKFASEKGLSFSTMVDGNAQLAIGCQVPLMARVASCICPSTVLSCPLPLYLWRRLANFWPMLAKKGSHADPQSLFPALHILLAAATISLHLLTPS